MSTHLDTFGGLTSQDTSDVEAIVRSAVEAGVIDGLSLGEFDAITSNLTGSDREDFIQTQWDRI